MQHWITQKKDEKLACFSWEVVIFEYFSSAGTDGPVALSVMLKCFTGGSAIRLTQINARQRFVASTRLSEAISKQLFETYQNPGRP